MVAGKPDIYTDESLYVLVSCETGNNALDEAVEKSIIGYTNLVSHCLKSSDKFERLGKLIDLSQEMIEKFK